MAISETNKRTNQKASKSRGQAWLIALLGMALCSALVGCATQQATASRARQRAPQVTLEMSHGVPIGRDDEGQAVLRVIVFESEQSQVAVPYLYGYPLYSDQGGHAAIRKLRHENWEGYERSVREADDGVVYVREHFPALGCTFEGIEEGGNRLVPLSLQCEVPPPEALGGRERAVVGSLQAGASPKAVREEPALRKAFLGEWHATTPDFDGKNGVGYFATRDGLLGFGFERGRLASVSFHFDPPQATWRQPELWAAPGP